MPLYRMDLEYLGTRYRGWQAQSNAQTLANAVLAAAAKVFGTVRELQAAGRTDSGVHALGQVAHLDAVRAPKDIRAARLALNDLLPPDIAVTRLEEAPQGFHARFAAVERVYFYQILRRRSAFGADLCWWVRDKLDARAMAKAAEILEGRHDFSSFCQKDPRKKEDAKVDLKSVEIGEDGPFLLLRFRAPRFLWKMVRRMAGFLVETGRGRFTPEQARQFLAKPAPELAAFTAPPSGLFLEKVLYGKETYEKPLNAILRIGP